MSTPATEIRSFAVTIPAGTPLASPVTTAISFPPRVVIAVHWRVPPGPSGLMGWRLTMSGGNPVIPTGGSWIITDNDSAEWPVVSQPDSGAWELTGYNTDIYDHSVYLDFLLGLVAGPVSVAAAAAPIDAAALSAPPAAAILAPDIEVPVSAVPPPPDVPAPPDVTPP